jgi:hypothetical protein
MSDFDFEGLNLKAVELQRQSSVEYEKILFKILGQGTKLFFKTKQLDASTDDEEAMKIKEDAITKLSDLYVKHKY